MRDLNATLAAPDVPWTPEFLAYVLPLTAEHVLLAGAPRRGAPPGCRSEWAWIQTAQRLVETHGPDEALRRLNGYGD